MTDFLTIHLCKEDHVKYGLSNENCLEEKVLWVKFLNREVIALKELEKMTGKAIDQDSQKSTLLKHELLRRKAFLNQIITWDHS